MTADQFNALYPVGTPVTIYPGARPERGGRAIQTHTRTAAYTHEGHTDAVFVGDYSGFIALTHVDIRKA